MHNLCYWNTKTRRRNVPKCSKNLCRPYFPVFLEMTKTHLLFLGRGGRWNRVTMSGSNLASQTFVPLFWVWWCHCTRASACSIVEHRADEGRALAGNGCSLLGTQATERLFVQWGCTALSSPTSPGEHDRPRVWDYVCVETKACTTPVPVPQPTRRILICVRDKRPFICYEPSRHKQNILRLITWSRSNTNLLLLLWHHICFGLAYMAGTSERHNEFDTTCFGVRLCSLLQWTIGN